MTVTVSGIYTKVMAPALNTINNLKVSTFFQQLFTSGSTIIEQDANAVEIEIQRGTEFAAAFLERGTDSINTTLKSSLVEKYTQDVKLFPLMEETTPITSGMVDKKMMGEPISGVSRLVRQVALATKAHAIHIQKIIRAMEISASEAFRTGLQTIQDGLQYNFYRNSTHNISATTVWSTSATAVPVDDISGGCVLIAEDSGRVPTDVIFGGTAWEEFLATTQVLALADLRRIDHFASGMTMPIPDGYEGWVAAKAVYHGKLQAGDYVVNLWTYPSIYKTDAGTKTKFMPATQVIIMAMGSRYDRYFGPKDRLETVDDAFFSRNFGIGNIQGMPENILSQNIFSEDMFHMDAYGGNNNKALTIRTQAAPIFAPVEADSIVKLTT